MIGLLDVEAGQAPQPSADATYTIVPGAAIEGPTELEAGRHVLEIAAEAGAEGLEPTLIRLDPGISTDEFFVAVDAAFGTRRDRPRGRPSDYPATSSVCFTTPVRPRRSTSLSTSSQEPTNCVLVDSDADPSGEDVSVQGHLSIVVAE